MKKFIQIFGGLALAVSLAFMLISRYNSAEFIDFVFLLIGISGVLLIYACGKLGQKK